MTILIVAGRTDAEARRVSDELQERQVPFSLLDTAVFPEGLRLSEKEGDLYVSWRKFERPDAVYLRGLACHPLIPNFHEALMERPHGFVAQCEEKRAFLESLMLIYEHGGARFVNTLSANRQHGCKPWQLRLLGAAGLPVPQWVATNDPVTVRTFARQVGDCVYKPLAGGATVRLLGRDDLSAERMAALDLAPVLFQEYYAGVSVRAFVAGDRVVAAAEIHSGEIDYRRDEREVVPTQLSPEECEAALAAARACSMAFTGVDLIRGADGFRVLECNPSPMFAVFEQKTGLEVGGPLAELLAQ